MLKCWIVWRGSFMVSLWLACLLGGTNIEPRPRPPNYFERDRWNRCVLNMPNGWTICWWKSEHKRNRWDLNSSSIQTGQRSQKIARQWNILMFLFQEGRWLTQHLCYVHRGTGVSSSKTAGDSVRYWAEVKRSKGWSVHPGGGLLGFWLVQSWLRCCERERCKGSFHRNQIDLRVA